MHGEDDEVQRIVAMRPHGALALAALSVTVLLVLWLGFFVFVFMPRGAIG